MDVSLRAAVFLTVFSYCEFLKQTNIDCRFDGTLCGWNATRLIQGDMNCGFQKSACEWKIGNWYLGDHGGLFPPTTTEEANVTSPLQLSASRGKCLIISYRVKSGSNLKVLLNEINNGQKQLLFVAPSNRKIQQTNRITIFSSKMFTVTMSSFNGGHERVKIRSVKMLPNSCSGKNYDCDFETSACEFKSSLSPSSKWTRSSASSSHGKHRPTFDHTKGKDGWYLYLDHEKRPIQEKSSVQSSVITQVLNNTCVRFWYYISSGRISIGEDIIISRAMNLLMTETYSKAAVWANREKDYWSAEEFTIRGHKQFILEFSAVAPKKDKDVCIALDDIDVMPYACPPRGSCEFTTDMCTWVSATRDEDKESEWRQITASIGNISGGPAEDHTTSRPSGGYMYLNRKYSLERKLQAGRAVSIVIRTGSSNLCLEFWYYLRSGDLGISVDNLFDEEFSIWNVTGDQGGTWNEANVMIDDKGPRFRKEFRLVVYGRYVKATNHSIALDDVKVHKRKCKTPTSSPMVPSTTELFTETNTRNPSAGTTESITPAKRLSSDLTSYFISVTSSSKSNSVNPSTTTEQQTTSGFVSSSASRRPARTSEKSTTSGIFFTNQTASSSEDSTVASSSKSNSVNPSTTTEQQTTSGLISSSASLRPARTSEKSTTSGIFFTNQTFSAASSSEASTVPSSTELTSTRLISTEVTRKRGSQSSTAEIPKSSKPVTITELFGTSKSSRHTSIDGHSKVQLSSSTALTDRPPFSSSEMSTVINKPPLYKSKEHSDRKLALGGVAGIVGLCVAIAVTLTLATFVGIWFHRRRKIRQREKYESPPGHRFNNPLFDGLHLLDADDSNA